MKHRFILRILIASLGINLAWGFSLPSSAQTQFQNPLEVQEFNDPLLPNPPVPRPLSPLEKFRLEQALDQLNQQARNRYQQGNVAGAFEIWYRELRLRQKLKPIQEVKALGRVGEIAWSENRSQDFRNIKQRLQTIETTAKNNDNRELMKALAQTYEQMRALDRAIAIYQNLVKESGNPTPILEKTAQLYEEQFAYKEAANIYEKLLEKATEKNNTVAKINYLSNLKYLYEQGNKPEQGITVKQRLIELYQQQNNQQALPGLMVALGEDYAQTNQGNQASRTYQNAFDLAWSQQKYAIASDALSSLAQLYRKDGSLDTTLQIYEQLLIVHRQSSDHYGLMMTYDQIGQLHQQQDQAQKAITAYENALQIAQSLNYQQDYFQQKIQQLKS
ncbi:MAG: tetratricopeptide repeat protein [Halothece sp.]